MALLDRFRSLPVSKHADPDVRLAYVEALSLDEREQLASLAREDDSARVRRAAVGKVLDPDVLAAVVREDADVGVRAHAMSMLQDVALEAFEETGETEGLAAIEVLSDVKTLSHIAKTATRESVARRALASITDPRARGSIARHAVLGSVRCAAFDALVEHEEIVAVAMNSEFKDTGVAAVERLKDRADLEQVALRSNNRSAAKLARGMLRKLDERAAPETAVSAEPPSDQPEPPPVIAVQALEIERTRADVAVVRLQEERSTAEREAATRAAALRAAKEAAEEQARKDVERRRGRLIELVQEVEAAAAEQDPHAVKRRLTFVRREWTDLIAVASAEHDLISRYTAAETRLTERETEARAADVNARREAVKRLHQLLARVEPLTTSNESSAKAVDRALHEIRSALAAVPPLPGKRDYDEITRRLKAAQGGLTPKLQELRALEDWQRWANVGIQEALCEKMEALKTSDDPPAQVVSRVRDLQQQWRQAADVPRTQGELLWRRFKVAHDEVWVRCEAFFAAEADKRAENLSKKLTLCERIEALAESTDWIRTGEQIKSLQAEWKTVGPVSRGQEKAIWERFRASCDRFFTRRHEDLARRKAVWTENFARKEALCAKAESLAESSEWETAAADIRRLQAEWKTVGPVKRSRSEAIWQRFRNACDTFFVRYARRHEIVRGEHLAMLEAICADLEALATPAQTGAEPPSELMATVRSIRNRWQQAVAAERVEPERAATLDRRFDAAFHGAIARWPQVLAGTDLDPEANRTRMEVLVLRIEDLASSLNGPAAGAVDGAVSPTLRLAAMLKEALAANTIGGKVDENSRWHAAQDEVRQAQRGWSRIGPVPEPARRALGERFQRACRRIAERAGGPGQAGEAGRAAPARFTRS